MKRCDQCVAAMINGVFCHETGCPNARKKPRKWRGYPRNGPGVIPRASSGAVGTWKRGVLGIVREQRCPDCGEYGERAGHQTCQYPKDHP